MTNSGDANNAVFDFVIPRGEPGPAGGSLDVLATVNSTAQQPVADTALIFSDTPLVSGSAISHAAGAPYVTINQPGVYQATFHAIVTPAAGATIPAPAVVRLNLDGAIVTGGAASHTFTSSNESSTLSFSIPFRAAAVPANVTVTVENSGRTFENAALTVVRLGDA